MMSKVVYLIAAGFVLTGCNNIKANDNIEIKAADQENITETKANEMIEVTVSIKVDGEELTEDLQTVEVAEDAILLDVMKEHYDITEVDTFINSINGYEQDIKENKYWLFDIDGEMAPAGANDIKLQEGDFVEWKLEEIS